MSDNKEPFEMVQTFEKYLEQEREKSRKRTTSIVIVFAVVLIIVVLVFCLVGSFFLNQISSNRSMAMQSQLIEAVLTRTQPQTQLQVHQPVPQPVTQPVPQPVPHYTQPYVAPIAPVSIPVPVVPKIESTPIAKVEPKQPVAVEVAPIAPVVVTPPTPAVKTPPTVAVVVPKPVLPEPIFLEKPLAVQPKKVTASVKPTVVEKGGRPLSRPPTQMATLKSPPHEYREETLSLDTEAYGELTWRIWMK